MIANLLAPSFDSKHAFPHCVIELSNRLYKRMKKNIIMVTRMHVNSKNLIEYDNIEYGSNIVYRDVAGVKQAGVSRMKHRYFIIVTEKKSVSTVLRKGYF